MLTQVTAAISEHTAPLASDTQRVLAIGGILLIASGMLFGDIFAMFALHPNNARIGAAMYTAAGLIPTGDVDGILAQFMAIGGFLEFRGTKVDTHSHIIHMGYIALLLAMLQPWVALSPRVRHRTAWLFILCAALMPPAILRFTMSVWPTARCRISAGPVSSPTCLAPCWRWRRSLICTACGATSEGAVTAAARRRISMRSGAAPVAPRRAFYWWADCCCW